MPLTTWDKGFTIDEVDSTYTGRKDRFVVSLIVGFGAEEQVHTPREAVARMLDFINDADASPDTNWYVHDRETGVTGIVRQREAEDGIDTEN